MWESSVQVVEDGTANGVVYHSPVTVQQRPSVKYKVCTSSAGRGHIKHQQHHIRLGAYGVAGQDVFGHDHHSISVADGHGKDGLYAAYDAIQMHHEIKIDPTDLVQDLRKVETTLRARIVSRLLAADFDYSGATFANMTFVTFGSRRWSITVNIGDSEALLVYKNHIHTCSVAHNWDNLKLYNRYVGLVSLPKPVCYNRWNASKYRLQNAEGKYRPIMMYDIAKKKAVVNMDNAHWVSELHTMMKRPKIRYGTQSLRLFDEAHENWGSCVVLNGSARGQNMATFGDCKERSLTKVPVDMVHVYIHEIPADETVIGLVQSDGISNMLSLQECGQIAWSSVNAKEYISHISNARDDMSVAMYISEPIVER